MSSFIETRVFKTVAELFDTLAPWKNNNILNGFIFRGHADENYKLIPSALRIEDSEYLWKICGIGKPVDKQWDRETWQINAEYSLLKSFYRETDQKGLVVPISNRLRKSLAQDWDALDLLNYQNNDNWIYKDLLEVAALAQHYGIPTRLIDWTYDLFIAMYFAFRGALNKDSNMVIWCLNKKYLSFLKPTVNNVNIDFIIPHYAGNPNLNAQKGLFTHWPIKVTTLKEQMDDALQEKAKITDRTTLDKLIENSINKRNNQPIFKKFIIPNSEAKKGCQILDKLGYDAGKVFPGYYGIVKQIRDMNLYI